MKKLLLVIITITVATYTFSQKVHLNLFAGVANYKGDLQYNSSTGKQFTLRQAKPAIGIGAEYELSDKFYLRGGLTFGKITADDKKGDTLQQLRNLNFTSPITDVMLGLEYYIINPYEHKVSPYVFAGIAFFKFNPYTNDTTGQKVYLEPLRTEGQGFVEGRDPYKLTQISIPFGAGVKFSLSETIRLGVEVSMRKTFTDYLDDVSTTYIDENLLLAERGSQAVELAYRGDEVKIGAMYPAEGTARGTEIADDWYYFTGLTLSIRLGGGGGGFLKGKGKYGCPAVN